MSGRKHPDVGVPGTYAERKQSCPEALLRDPDQPTFPVPALGPRYAEGLGQVSGITSGKLAGNRVDEFLAAGPRRDPVRAHRLQPEPAGAAAPTPWPAGGRRSRDRLRRVVARLCSGCVRRLAAAPEDRGSDWFARMALAWRSQASSVVLKDLPVLSKIRLVTRTCPGRPAGHPRSASSRVA
jgi:hypothetical protein